MNPEVLLYSANEDITYSELKNLDSSKYSTSISDVQKIQEIFEHNGIDACIMGDNSYHTKFHSIISAPYIMHYMGDLSILDKDILGIVGPRKHTRYSFNVLQHLFESAQCYDFVTISGMAEGVDQLCHSFSVKYHIPTIAVLGGGIYHYLQGQNRYILDTIVNNGGLILSEYKIGFKPTNYSFPQRNRIIAGLCDKLFLPEAGKSSGSLITVDYAYHQNKPIFAVPNDIFSEASAGLNQLISDNKAQIVTDIDTFLENNFNKIGGQQNKKAIELSGPQKDIISELHSRGPSDVNSLIKGTGLDTNTLMINITMLEMNNYIYQDIPGIYGTNI